MSAADVMVPDPAEGPEHLTELVEAELAALAVRLAGEVAERLTGLDGIGDRHDPAREAFAHQLLMERLEVLAREFITQGRDPLSEAAEEELVERVQARLFGLAELDRLVRDPSIENVFCNRFDQVFVKRTDGGKEEVAAISDSDDGLAELLRQAAARDGRSERRFDRGQPWVSFQLGDARLTAVREVSGATVFALRRHGKRTADLQHLYEVGTISQALLGLFNAAVHARLNLLIVGGTDAGKTTLLRALINAVPPQERLVTVEDALELQLAKDSLRHPDVVELECREQNIEGQGEVTMRDLTRLALRLSPDRVIVGEARGPEILEMFQAMSQGNDGSMGTLHARSSADAFVQIMRYALKAPEHLTPEAVVVDIAASLDWVIHLHKLRDGRRVVSSVREITGYDAAQVISNEVFTPDPFGRASFSGRPFQERTLDTLIDHGFDPRLLDVSDGTWTW